MSGLSQRHLGYAFTLIAVAGAVAAWVLTAPEARTFSVTAREVSFTSRAGGSEVAPPALVEPRAIHEVEVTGTTGVAGAALDQGDHACVIGTSTPAQAISLVKPLLPRGDQCTSTVRWTSSEHAVELAFRSWGLGCAFGAEVSLEGAGSDSPSMVPVAEVPELTCRRDPAEAGAEVRQERSVPLTARGWTRARSNRRAFTVWDSPVGAGTFEAVLNQPASLGFSENKCAGAAGDVVRFASDELKLSGLSVQPEGLLARVAVSSSWRAEIGGCVVSSVRQRWRDVLIAWFTGFASLGGLATVLSVLNLTAGRSRSVTHLPLLRPGRFRRRLRRVGGRP